MHSDLGLSATPISLRRRFRSIRPLLTLFLLLPGCGEKREVPQPPKIAVAVDDAAARGEPAEVRSTGNGRAIEELEPPIDSQLARARQLLRDGKADQAWSLVEPLLVRAPEDSQVIEHAARARAAQGIFREAAQLFDSLELPHPELRAKQKLQSGDWYLQAGKAVLAEQRYRELIALAPDFVEGRRRLATLLNLQGRFYEQCQQLQEMLRLGDIRQVELLALLSRGEPVKLEPLPFPLSTSEGGLELADLYRAKVLYHENEIEASFAISQRLSTKHRDEPAVSAFHALLLVEQSHSAAFADWILSLPEAVHDQPDYWLAVGHWLRDQDNWKPAARAYAECLHRDPSHRTAARALAVCVERAGHPEMALQINAHLRQMDRAVHAAMPGEDTPLTAEQIRNLATILESLDRPWEANAWRFVAAQMAGDLDQQWPVLAERRRELIASAHESPPPPAALAGLELHRWPLPDIDRIAAAAESDASRAERRAPIEADRRRLNLVERGMEVLPTVPYVSGFAVGDETFFIYQIHGSGIAVFDYDNNGLSDLYFVQAGGSPQIPGSSQPNQLLRLRHPDGPFEEVPLAAGADDRGFGQGVAAADINQDGFVDLAIANVGPNAIYLNQGDGTLRLRNDLLPAVNDSWTASIGIGDLSGDHLPDLLEANFVEDPLAFTVRCTHDEPNCNPKNFSPAADRVLRQAREGQLEPWRGASGIQQMPNYGFATVICNFDGQHGNDVFVANDVLENHYWTSEPDSSSYDRFGLREAAYLRGCAVGFDGRRQACMGVAMGDFDRTGTLDLHVTNFYAESSNLFLQRNSGLFSDEIRRDPMYRSTLDVLGFGTQAIDVDNDGWLDLAVLNGHVHDQRSRGRPYQMLPQLFRGTAAGFVQQKGLDTRAYWSTLQLGRTLATLDWNRDGRMDLIATHLDRPAALLENQTRGGHWLQLQLVGVESERDAVGAKVVAEVAGQTLTEWVYGGDGFMCTNEPLVSFGLAEADHVDRLTIFWPAGTIAQFESLAADKRYLIVEGHHEPAVR